MYNICINRAFALFFYFSYTKLASHTKAHSPFLSVIDELLEPYRTFNSSVQNKCNKEYWIHILRNRMHITHSPIKGK